MRRLLAAGTIVLVIGLVCSLAYGQESSSNDNWQFSLAPMYLWAVSISGDQTVKGIDVDLDVSFGDVFNNLNGALIFHFEGLKQRRWGFWVDFNWIRLNPQQGTPIGDIDINYTEILAEAAGFYRWNVGPHNFDALGGLRYSNMSVDLDFPGPLPSVDQSKGWVNPFVGARWLWQMSERWNLILRGDIGGFGVGSDFTWNLVGLVDFKPWKHVSLFGGYRALYQDYEDGSGANEFKYDATMYGPILGLNITW